LTEYLFITGKLAANALQAVLENMAPRFTYKIEILNISVAALMNTAWIARHVAPIVPEGCKQIVIPGDCKGQLSEIQSQTRVIAVRGPKDLKDLPVFFGGKQDRKDYGQYRVKIIAEITEAYRMSDAAVIATAEYYRKSGADIIDLGGPAMGTFEGVDRIVRELKSRNFKVSLDSFDPDTIRMADRAGIDLLLSINSTNIDLAPRLKCKVVVIPDPDQGLRSLEENARKLEKAGVSFVLDPILNPLGLGFADSLQRYHAVRQRFPEAEIMMGIGNLTEMTDADSTGINAVMAGIVTELGIDYVLTTEVISWARHAVREFDLARRLMFYAQQHQTVPKRIDDRLITIKDPPFEFYSEGELRAMQQEVKDKNYRIFTDENHIYVFNSNCFVKDTHPQGILPRIEPLDAAHAFYLGRELERAYLAVRLKKRYCQDEDLRWGYLGGGDDYLTDGPDGSSLSAGKTRVGRQDGD
jgi:dihydropteroate synthase-like protein